MKSNGKNIIDNGVIFEIGHNLRFYQQFVTLVLNIENT